MAKPKYLMDKKQRIVVTLSQQKLRQHWSPRFTNPAAKLVR
jgi:hypothetical protein